MTTSRSVRWVVGMDVAALEAERARLNALVPGPNAPPPLEEGGNNGEQEE